MVEILCPHCEEEIELDDDAYGEFSCPYCDGEFEWGDPPKAGSKRADNPKPMDAVKAGSHALHGLGGIMLFTGMFTGWFVAGDFFTVNPFGMEKSLFGISLSSGWFDFFGDEDAVLAIFGIIFMILAITALVSQIIHLVFRSVIHMVDSGKLEVSIEMERRSYQYRWHTSLIALVCAVAGIVIMEIGLLISLGSDVAFPRPSMFAILLIVILAGQFYMMNEELRYE